VSEGAVYQLWQQRPQAIGIVDGSFNQARGVSHKEILWVMEQGVHVFGSAALGALRAVELANFGMRGVGWVYDAFSTKILDRDDEAAVAYSVSDQGYLTRSEAMVNIRRTLERARLAKIISATTCDILIVCGSEMPYRRRTWPGLLEAGRTAGSEPDELHHLSGWLPEGRVDQQAHDAVAMLRTMRDFLDSNPGRLQPNWAMAHTTAWERLKHRVRDLPAMNSETSLDSLLDEIRLLGPGSFATARDRSLLRYFAADVAEREGLMLSPERLHDVIVSFRIENGLESGADFRKFLTDNDLTPDEFKRLITVEEKVRWACERSAEHALEDLPGDLRMRGQYARLAAKAGDKRRSDENNETDGIVDSAAVAVRWYFEQRLEIGVPENLEEYARSAGFADESRFRSAVLREWQWSPDF
jgi:hypothetical protein